MLMLLLAGLLMLFVLSPFIFSLRHSHAITTQNKQWLLFTAVLPVVLATIIGLAMVQQQFILWQGVLWLQLGIVLMVVWRPIIDLGSMRRFAVLLLLAHIALLIGFNYSLVS